MQCICTEYVHRQSVYRHAATDVTCTGSELLDIARLLSGRALAHEGLAAWNAALEDYSTALQVAARADAQPDPYVLNARGNVLVSLARYAEVWLL